MPVSYSKQYTRAISLNLEHQRRLNLQKDFIDNVKKHKRADLNSHYHEIKAQLYNIRAKTPSVPDTFYFSSDEEEENFSIPCDENRTEPDEILKTDDTEDNKLNNNFNSDVKENNRQEKEEDTAPTEITPSVTNSARKPFGKRVSVIEPTKNEDVGENEGSNEEVEKEDDVDQIVNQFSLDYLLPLSSRNPKPSKSRRHQEVRSAEPKSPRNPFLKLDPITARRMIEVQTIQRKLYNLHAKRYNAKKAKQARNRIPNSPLWARGNPFTGKSDYTESTQGISRAKSAASLSRPPSVIRISPNRPYIATRSAKGIVNSNFIVNAQYYDD